MDDQKKTKTQLIDELTWARRRLATFEAQQAKWEATELTLHKTEEMLEQKAREWAAEYEAVRQASLSLTSSLELPQVLRAILRATLELTSAENAHIFPYFEGRLRFGAALFANGQEGEPFADPRPGGLTYTVAETGQPIIVDDMRSHPLYINSPYAIERAIIGLPLKFGQRVVGVMTLSRSQPFTPTDLRRLHLLADHAAVAIENAQLYEALQSARNELEVRVKERTAALAAVWAASLSLTASLELPEVLEAILRTVLELATADNAHIFLYDGERLNFGAALFADGRRGEPMAEPRSDGLTYRVAREGRPMVIDNMRTHHLYAHTKFNWDFAIIGLPLKIGQQVVGVMNLARPQQPFSEAEQHSLQLLADHAAIAIENARLYEAVQKAKDELEIRVQERTAQLEAVRQTSLSLTASLELPDVLEAILQAAIDLVSADNAHIFLYDGSQLTFGAALLAGGRRGEPLATPRSEGITYTVARQKEAIVVNDMSTHPLYLDTPFARKHAIISLPLKIGQCVVGVMNISRSRPFPEGTLRPLYLLADHAAIAIENAGLFTQTQSSNRQLQALTARLQEELTLAQKIQKSLLPPAQINSIGFSIACYSHPAQEVGGDFYAYHIPAYPVNGGQTGEHLAIAVGDVSGKGMPAALLMAISRASFQTAPVQRFSPSELLVYLDQTIMPYTQTSHQNCALVYLEIEAGIMRVANAGCISPIIKRAGGPVEWVDVGGMPLGVGLGAQSGYQEKTISLSPGDLVILTSDGVVEAKNGVGEIFGFERLEQAVRQRSHVTPEAMLNHLQAEITLFVGDEEPHDDLTIVVLQSKL